MSAGAAILQACCSDCGCDRAMLGCGSGVRSAQLQVLQHGHEHGHGHDMQTSTPTGSFIFYVFVDTNAPVDSGAGDRTMRDTGDSCLSSSTQAHVADAGQFDRRPQYLGLCLWPSAQSPASPSPSPSPILFGRQPLAAPLVSPTKTLQRQRKREVGCNHEPVEEGA